MISLDGELLPAPVDLMMDIDYLKMPQIPEFV